MEEDIHIRLFVDMTAKCLAPDHPMYHGYGGAGVKVSDEWMHSPSDFDAWVYANIPEDLPEGHLVELCLKPGKKEYGPDSCILIPSKRGPMIEWDPVDHEKMEQQAQAEQPPENIIQQNIVTYLTAEEYEERMGICESCEFLEGTKCTKFCKSCTGDLHASRRKDIKCPIGKW